MGGGLGLEMLVYLVYLVFFNAFVGFLSVCLGFICFSQHFLYFLGFGLELLSVSLVFSLVLLRVS